ncbi:hypothetical protein TTHERM_000790838 (macronuclear) [Tetrahymena thermophila SB210]|uniref:Uncharacterized protein n=1 Tax=Tetrahymena thermophila (strain SB210) TaxID=312017 RepID=W7WX63_TETTS|nr:hypothetical protein TTHERM_000790838 [Tetrahymena thermophila SB210]EWS71400.1 hypothetical protein TTHERM_000790838 [Tetrahymena thermophila SB210]|eukprot:XP_012656072.1 hypothetical protein TTHERM_000790838 [Tetrahymena thermophila SB210]
MLIAMFSKVTHRLTYLLQFDIKKQTTTQNVSYAIYPIKSSQFFSDIVITKLGKVISRRQSLCTFKKIEQLV